MIEKLIQVLIADDDLVVRTLMAVALENAGCHVILAQDGEKALQQFRNHPCDIVLLDVDMPGKSGFEVCSAIRAEVGNELPIVMVTGMDDVESVERAFDLGATDFIPKPINWALLGHRVRYLFRASRMAQELHRAHASNTALLDAVPDIILRMDTDGMVIDVHQQRMGQLSSTLLLGKGQMLMKSLSYEVAETIKAAAVTACSGNMPNSFEFEFEGKGGDESRCYEARLAAIDGRQALCLLRDITERKKDAQRINQLAYFDILTGLPNRLSFSEWLERSLLRARHQNEGLAVLALDIDQFKDVNDSFGHHVGDQMLCLVAERLRHSARPGDLVASYGPLGDEVDVARVGGDEFVLLMTHLSQSEDSLILAQRIHQVMQRPFVLEGREVVMTSSIGIAVYPDDGDSTESLLKHANTAMFHAKNLGRGNTQFYNASLTESAWHRLDLANNLRLALERDEFHLVYQPQVDVNTGLICSVEALIRWQSPQQGLVMPMDFIPFAEQNDFILPIGDWVLRAACADLARWHSAGHKLKVAVNLSGLQVQDVTVVKRIEAILAELSIKAEYISLELTESVVMESSTSTLCTLKAIRMAGMKLALDDFGTGYSSLSYLRQLPLDTLKIDKSFVSGLPTDAQDMTIVRTIIAMATNLGLTVIAEGVENIEQARILRDLGCDTLQGFWLSQPLPAGEINALLAKRWNLDE